MSTPSLHRGPLALAARLLLVLLVPAAVRAQAVTGFGDDATTPPGGRVRLTIDNEWTRYDQRFTAPAGASIFARS
ncbi:MAG TPA: hypothetical protein VFS44_08115, partial [Gemmatimonadaceae bacterium]|nr:hypothetical protein [Gemmatimonadaceae bacterium]